MSPIVSRSKSCVLHNNNDDLCRCSRVHLSDMDERSGEITRNAPRKDRLEAAQGSMMHRSTRLAEQVIYVFSLRRINWDLLRRQAGTHFTDPSWCGPGTLRFARYTVLNPKSPQYRQLGRVGNFLLLLIHRTHAERTHKFKTPARIWKNAITYDFNWSISLPISAKG